MQTIIRACLVACILSSSYTAWSAEALTIGEYKTSVPAVWKRTPPKNRMRYAQFSIPAAKGDSRGGELAVFYFGVNGGGGVEANIARWQKTFEAPKGKSIHDVTTRKGHDSTKTKPKYLTVGISGTYLYKERPFDPSLKAEHRKDHRMLAAIVETSKGPYYFRLVGPKETISQHAGSFHKMLKSLTK